MFKMRLFSLRHLQTHQPWTVPYSKEFNDSVSNNALRSVAHDLMHVMKSLGRVAAECERADHGAERRLQKDELAKEVADFVICALRIANLEGFDLHDAVVNAIESR